MFNVTAFRYRNVLALHGGPIESLEVAECMVDGVRHFQANARLRPELVPRRRQLAIYGSVDGTGTNSSPLLARFMATSEALERWAYHATFHSTRRRDYGFDLDASTNGMAAFPGLTVGKARQRAWFEAIERACVFDWWEGRCAGELAPIHIPGVQAVRIESPIKRAVTAIVFRECSPGCFAYGHAAAVDFTAACERAIVEMHRCSLVLCHHRLAHAAGRATTPTDRFERRCLFFSSPEGHDVFRRRLERGPTAPSRPWRIAHDGEIVGPWTRYATVWRVVIPAATAAFLSSDEEYFFLVRLGRWAAVPRRVSKGSATGCAG